MFKFPKAATIAAVSVALLSAGIIADPGFAFGGYQNDTALKAGTLQVDAGIIAADQTFLNTAMQPSVVMTVGKDGAIVFVPGTGTGPGTSTGKTQQDTGDKGAVIAQDNDNAAAFDDNDIPKKTSAASLADLVRMQDTQAALSREAHCLAGAVYFEAKSESLAGQLAVAKVVMARASSGRFAPSICGVVFQKSQFSFVRGNSMPRIDTSGAQWKNATAIAKIAQSGSWKSPVEGALYFHARRVSPGWRLKRIGSVDNHVFYR